MNVSFSTKDEYFNELSLATEGTVVRATVEKFDENEGVSQWAVVSGYYDDMHYYEARIDCGENWAGGKKEGSETSGILLNEIADLCEKLKLKHRGGRFQCPQ